MMMIHDKEARELLPFATCSPNNFSPTGGPGLFLFVSNVQDGSSGGSPVSHVTIGEGSSNNLKPSGQTSQQLLQTVTTAELQPAVPFLFEKLDNLLTTLRSPVESSSAESDSISVLRQAPGSTRQQLLTATPLLDSESRAKSTVVTLTDCSQAKGMASRMIERVGSLMAHMPMSEQLGEARSQPLVETIGESLYLETEDEENRKLTGKESKIEMMVKTPLKLSVQLELRELSYEVEVQAPQPTWQALFSSLRGSDENSGSRKAKKTLLQHISLQIEPGDFVAIMGPTGCGKTTLLNILSGRVRSGVKGTFLVNGKKLSKDIKRSTAYVMQDDILFSFLTVNDTLNVTAELRLSKIADPEERHKRTQEIVSALNLIKCQNTKIGNQWVRGVSGGERKRVNIANELITNPSLVLLDEPTSGLDSSTSLSLIETIGDIAASGRTVITTIHQPSSQMFEKFDKLLLLAEGRIVYFGKASDALNYFASLGHFSPPNYNPADFFMGLILDEELKGGEAKRASLIEAYEKKTGSSAVLLPKQSEAALKDESSEDDEDGVNSKYGAGYIRQVRVLLWRTVKQSLGELDIFNYLQVIFISIIIGILWWQIGDTESNINDRAGALFFIVSFVGGFFPLFNALSAFPRERPIIIRERSSGTYHLSSYFLAKWINEFPHVLSFPILLMCIVYWMVGFEKNESFLWSTLGMCLSALTSSGMGLLFSIWITNFKTVMTFTSVIVLSLMLVGGFYIKSYNLPGWIAWLRYLSWIKYSFEIQMRIQFPVENTYGNKTGEDVLAMYDITTPLWVDIIVLLLMGIAVRLLGYFCFRYNIYI